MIRFIEASGGSGKTCIVVEWLTKLVDDGVYDEIYANIEDLRILGIKKLPEGGNWLSVFYDSDGNRINDDGKKRLFVIDEPQYLEPFMIENTSKNNKIGKMLSTHRHYGADLWFITQSADLVNKYVKGNVGEHVVIYRPRKKKMIRVYWWSMYQKNLSKSAFKTADDEYVYYLNPEMFKLYKSTSAVTDDEVRTSTKLNSIIFSSVIVFLVIGGVIYNGLSSFKSMYGIEDDKSSVMTVSPDKISSKMQVEEQLPTIPPKAENEPIQPNVEQTVPRQQELVNNQIQPSDVPVNNNISSRQKYLDDYVLEVAYNDEIRPVSIVNFGGECRAFNKYGDTLKITQKHCKEMLINGNMPKARQGYL